jgi:hypothetical protein
MEITLNRLRARSPRWNAENVTHQDIDSLVTKMLEQPFEGSDDDYKYGFAHCGRKDDVLYGLFVQKFPKKVTDYNPQTKEETTQAIRDSGAYLFIFYPKRYELYLQARRSADLPGTTEIIKRFVGLMKLAVGINGKFMATTFDYTEDEVDRGHIVDIFYNQADSITELELEDFDRQLVYEQKNERGNIIQTYFNPIDEYQPAMEEAALRFGTNAERVIVKAKRNENFKKDPIVRAMLEGSRKPVRIVYKKDSETHTEYGVTKKKEIISIESDEFDLDNQIDTILARLEGSDTLRQVDRRARNDQQTGLFGE